MSSLGVKLHVYNYNYQILMKFIWSGFDSLSEDPQV